MSDSGAVPDGDARQPGGGLPDPGSGMSVPGAVLDLFELDAARAASSSDGPVGEPGPSTHECLMLYRRLAAGVTIITSRDRHGPIGMTASAVTSVSLRPPMLLACLASNSRTLAAITWLRAFSVQLLTDQQTECANRFAGRSADERFADVAWRDVLGVPTLDNTLAWAVCHLVDCRQYGDHHVIVGEAVATHVGGGSPLLWHDRAYGTVRPAA